MLSNFEDSPPATPPWPWKKMAAGLLVFLVSIFTLIVVWDEKAQPFPELMKHRRAMPPEPANGYLDLIKTWNPWPERTSRTHLKWASSLQQKWLNMQLGRSPWDNTVADALNPTSRDLSADLTKALAAPAWMIPIPGSILSDDTILDGINALRATAFQRLLENQAGPALDLIFQLRQLSRRQISGSNYGQDFQLGCAFDMYAATLTAQLMVMIPQDEATLRRLAECWAEDQLSQEDFGPVAAGHSVYFEANLEAGADGLYLTSWRKWHHNLTTKRNQSVNRMNRMLAAVSTGSLATAPERSLSLYEATDQLKYFIDSRNRATDANWGGNFLILWTFTSSNYGAGVYLTIPRKKLFAARAARVAVAMKRYQLAHGGPLPERLTVLVPDFLPAVPLDPWNGQPLQWDPVHSILSAVGEDWKASSPDPKAFGMSGLGMAVFGSTHYSLDRANAVPPPPPAPPAAARKKR